MADAHRGRIPFSARPLPSSGIPNRTREPDHESEPSARSKLALRATWALLLAGVLAGCGIGALTYRSVEYTERASLEDSVQSRSSALATMLQRDEDFVMSQQGMLETFPGLTNPQYMTAIKAADVAVRFPGSMGFTFVERVPAADLAAFARKQAADPIKGVPTPPPSHFAPIPPGKRAQYCLISLGYQSGPVAQESEIATFDFCAPLPTVTFPQALGAAAASASLTVAPPFALYPDTFFLVAPVYRGGVVPHSVVARRSQVVGWVLGAYSVDQTLLPVLGGTRSFGLQLSYRTGAGPTVAVGAIGASEGGTSYSTSVPIGASGRWYITVVGSHSSGANEEAVLVGLLVLGIAILLFAIIRLLAGSRQRALLLVDERTREVRYQALHDSLTGLPNRDLIVNRATQMLARSASEASDVRVLFTDLDNFKEINDSFGHQRGDQLLRAVGDRLASIVRPSDSVGRLGGDEFIILLQGTILEAGPALVAERVLEILSEPFLLDGMEDTPLNVRASIGIAVGSRPDADELLRDADVALYQAKRDGKGRYVLFEPEMRLAVQDRLALEMDLRTAISDGQLYVEYQPIFNLSTLEMTGVEALARWRHPTRGDVGPDRFIPVAEDSGLIGPLGNFVLNEACRQAAAWSARGRPTPLSVNISGHQLRADSFMAELQAALETSGLDPALLTLELTETVLMHDVDRMVPRLQALKALGLQLAIDDFGTGYSSLACLLKFPVDALKIDRSFIAGIGRSRESRALIHALVQLGKTLGLSTLAEGIEDQAQLSELQREQCDHGQGFYYARPLGASALEALWSLTETSDLQPKA